jgi:nitroimidazol reductase NimA-like FMN-containing flavoprotein (pyridoxamine 5'-phosphate oxidase superfamily)
MPGYGVVGPEAGSGLLPWSWAEEQLRASRHFWLATTWPEGRPHMMPVWAVWEAGRLWFSSSLGSRKVRNLVANPAVVLAREDALNPVMLEGRARVASSDPELRHFLDLVNAKYETDYSMELVDPTLNATVEVRPRWVFGLRSGDFTGSPTRWRVGEE